MKLILLLTLTIALQAGQTQSEMNEQACAGLKKAEAAMQHTADQVLAANASDPNFVKAFNAAQASWLAFRDAHITALYPDPAPNAYGTVNTMCKCMQLEALTKERTMQIRDTWIKGTIPSDACIGSQAVHQPRTTSHKQPPKTN